MAGIADLVTPFAGGFAAVATAFFWALSALAFARAAAFIPVLEVNLYKSIIGSLLIGALLLALGDFPFHMQPATWGFFAASGVAGIALGDIAYLYSLTRLGVRRTMLVGTLAPPLTALAAWAFLGERLPASAWLGLGFTVAGVAWVITERRSLDPNSPAGETGQKPRRVSGLSFGLLFALATALSSLFSRAGFNHEAVGAFEAAEVRLLAATLVIIPMLVLGFGGRTPLLAWSRRPNARPAAHSLLFGSLAGTFTAMVLLQVSLKLAPAGIAQTLISTNALFALGFAALQGEKVSPRSVFGVLLALAGVALLFSGLG